MSNENQETCYEWSWSLHDDASVLFECEDLIMRIYYNTLLLSPQIDIDDAFLVALRDKDKRILVLLEEFAKSYEMIKSAGLFMTTTKHMHPMENLDTYFSEEELRELSDNPFVPNKYKLLSTVKI